MALLQSAHSQDDGQDADELGVRLAAAAGFAPAATITLLERIERLGPCFTSHPPPGDRKVRLGPLCRQLIG